MSDRWSIYIDIDGFSALWDKEDQVLWSLGELMRAIFLIGRECYPNSPERIFAHQFGDGFVIVSDFHEDSLERCVAIAIALMRHVAATGRLARASISEGEFSDIQGCYPKEVLDCLESDHTVSLHMGLMTINPVMGTALIRAVGVDKRAPRGPLLTIESGRAPRLGSVVTSRRFGSGDLVSIDWVHSDPPQLGPLQTRAGLRSPTPTELDAMLADYCREQPVPEEWRKNVYSLLAVPEPDGAFYEGAPVKPSSSRADGD